MLVQSRLSRLGTQLQAAYAWQGDDLVTVVSPFSDHGEGAFLSVHLRQPIPSRGLLPRGTVLTVDGQNLAQQGYVVVASREGTGPAALAATLRSLQAGLSFTF